MPKNAPAHGNLVALHSSLPGGAARGCGAQDKRKVRRIWLWRGACHSREAQPSPWHCRHTEVPRAHFGKLFQPHRPAGMVAAGRHTGGKVCRLPPAAPFGPLARLGRQEHFHTLMSKYSTGLGKRHENTWLMHFPTY